MEPPSYEEASLHPPVLGSAAFHTLPPPTYSASLHLAPAPPPSYGEAVTIQPDHFPILTVPQYNGAVIHPVTQIGVTSSAGRQQTEPAVVTTQPAPVPISVGHLGDSPGLVCCPHCRNVVTSKVKYQPGMAAWCTCLLLALMGLICGCCLIPLMTLQDVHHSCPHCEKKLHVHTR